MRDRGFSGACVTLHVIQRCFGAQVLTLAKRPSSQLAQNFHSKYVIRVRGLRRSICTALPL